MLSSNKAFIADDVVLQIRSYESSWQILPHRRRSWMKSKRKCIFCTSRCSRRGGAAIRGSRAARRDGFGWGICGALRKDVRPVQTRQRKEKSELSTWTHKVWVQVLTLGVLNTWSILLMKELSEHTQKLPIGIPLTKTVLKNCWHARTCAYLIWTTGKLI